MIHTSLLHFQTDYLVMCVMWVTVQMELSGSHIYNTTYLHFGLTKPCKIVWSGGRDMGDLDETGTLNGDGLIRSLLPWLVLHVLFLARSSISEITAPSSTNRVISWWTRLACLESAELSATHLRQSGSRPFDEYLLSTSHCPCLTNILTWYVRPSKSVAFRFHRTSYA